jgi:hypothetical protein
MRLETAPEPTKNGCWAWLGPLDLHGYGLLRGGTRHTRFSVRAARAAWCLHHWGTDITYEDVRLLPARLQACHTCDHPWCVNPGHIFLGPLEMNMHDAASKGRLHRSHLTLADIPRIREMYAGGGWTMRALARHYRLGVTAVWRIVNRVSYDHVP